MHMKWCLGELATFGARVHWTLRSSMLILCENFCAGEEHVAQGRNQGCCGLNAGRHAFVPSMFLAS